MALSAYRSHTCYLLLLLLLASALTGGHDHPLKDFQGSKEERRRGRRIYSYGFSEFVQVLDLSSWAFIMGWTGRKILSWPKYEKYDFLYVWVSDSLKG
jgi:hypothetical protein